MQETTRRTFDADVVIVGSGPTGLLLALMLGRQGHQVCIVERWPSHYPLPRAVTFDDEVARILSGVGIDAENDPRIEHFDVGWIMRDAAWNTLATYDWSGLTPLGWRRLYWFHQPELEARLAEMVARQPTVRVRQDWEAVNLQQDAEGVRLTGRVGAHGQQAGGAPASTEVLRARYLVGADGANSFVRQAAGLPMKDLGFFFDWLIVDVRPRVDLGIEPPAWQLCDPARPATVVPAGPGRRRWEFMALPGEDLQALNTEAAAWRLLQPWGATPETAELERHTVWRFQARWSERWREGRVLIAGDAAHQMPPFAGQGMCAGLRDAGNLGWRLDLVLRGVCGPALLDAYGEERKAHVSHFIQLSMEIGRAVCVTDPQAACERDAALRAAMADPSLAPPPPPPLTLGSGTWAAGTPQAGQAAWLGVVRSGAQSGRLDSVVGTGWLLLGWKLDPATALSKARRARFARLGGRCVAIDASGVQGQSAAVEDNEGFYAAWFERLGVDLILLRPDQYVAASGRVGDFAAALDRVLDAAALPAA